MTPCPCGGPSYDSCCGPLHDGRVEAGTAEQLMRARFSAYAVGDDAFVLRTWHPETRPVSLAQPPDLRWVGLEVLRTAGGGHLEETGTVEFVAQHVRGGRPGELHEISRFVRDDRRWVYLGPDLSAATR